MTEKQNKTNYKKLTKCNKLKLKVLGNIYKHKGDIGALDQAIYILHKKGC